MMRVIAVLLFGGALLAVAAAPGSVEPPVRKDFFCPDCWKFLNEPGDLDPQGRCVVSGKTPVQVDVVTVNWFWCGRHQEWHRRPCGRDAGNPYPSTALLVNVGSEMIFERAYCPEHRMFSDLAHPGMKCPIDGKPMAAAEAVERRWYWCRTEQAWLPRPSPSNAKAKCCTLRSGLVPASPWQYPFIGFAAPAPATRNELFVDADWLAAHLDEPHVAVLHVGFDPAEASEPKRTTYYDGHIPGARPVDWSELAVIRNGIPDEFPPLETLVAWVRSLGIDLDDRIILYDTGSGIEAARAYLTLDYLGLGNKAALLNGQWAGWIQANRPISRMPESVEPSVFLPRLRPEILVGFQEMNDLSWLVRQDGASATLLDARSAEEFHGRKAGRGILRPGHIAGASNLCWGDMLEPMVDAPFLRNEPSLRALFEGAGARPGRMLVTYCRTGREAALVYVAAKFLGYDARFYDGSYAEWSRERETPVEGNWAK